MYFFEIFKISGSIWALPGRQFCDIFRTFGHAKKKHDFSTPGGRGEDPRIPFGKGWDLGRRLPSDAYGRPRPGAAYLKVFVLCRRPPILDSPAFWLATFLAPKPDICELWWAHFGILDRHLGGLGVLGDTQQHILGSRWCFFRFSIILGSLLEPTWSSFC